VSKLAKPKLEDKWIDIFRAGDYGEKGSFTEADLDRVAASYSPAEHEAPVVIGHPDKNLPAYGWVDSVRRVGATLQAKFAQVAPEFAEMVEAGRFKQRSASFYKDAAGKISGLRHVGFLGAQPPEVKGLRPIQFSEQESTEVDFEEASMAAEDTILARLNAWFDDKFGKNTAATAIFSEADAKRIASEAVTAAVAPLQAKIDAQATQLAAHAATFSESQKAAATADTRTRAANAIAKLKAGGKWVPAFDRMGLPVVFDELAKTTETVSFGEGEAKKTLTPLDTFVQFMEGLGQIVPSTPVYTGQRSASAAGAMKGVNAAPGRVDANSVAFSEAIASYMDEKKVDYATAMFKVAELRPELTVPGGAAAGAV